jgi:hypothetical protein
MKSSLALILVAAMAAACSDDSSAGQPAPQDAGTQTDTSSGGNDVSADAPATNDVGVGSDAPTTDRFIDIFDAFGVPDGPLGDCVGCIRDKCGAEVNQCVNNPACRAGLQCTLTTCVSSGMPDIACVLGCFMGDTAAALSAGAALMCINSKCSSVCAPGGLEGGMLDASRPDGAPADTAPPGDVSQSEAASPEAGSSEASVPGEAGGSGD